MPQDKHYAAMANCIGYDGHLQTPMNCFEVIL